MRGANGESAVRSTTIQPLSRVNPYGGLSIHHPKLFCAPTRTRTWNPLIKSQLLYQLSHGCGTRMRLKPYFAGVEGAGAGVDGAPDGAGSVPGTSVGGS